MSHQMWPLILISSAAASNISCNAFFRRPRKEPNIFKYFITFLLKLILDLDCGVNHQLEKSPFPL